MMKNSGVSASTISYIRFFDDNKLSFRGVTKDYDEGSSSE